ncbi:hypothetical protein BBJ28_00017201 [Nothophytophthora sp. Chile5]|nr:hypothetical protein BBJ28_00017201 [Nothophytophthora sp. Chile5]
MDGNCQWQPWTGTCIQYQAEHREPLDGRDLASHLAESALDSQASGEAEGGAVIQRLPRGIDWEHVAFAAVLLSPLPSPEQRREGGARSRHLLERIECVGVVQATRERDVKRKIGHTKGHTDLTLELELALRPERPLPHVGIFYPNNAAVPTQRTRSFQEVTQLGKLLLFCVRRDREDGCHNATAGGVDCAFCSQLRVYLKDTWKSLPLVAMGRDGVTVLRKAVLSKGLEQLVDFATDKTTLGQERESVACAARDEVSIVLHDFFFAQPACFVMVAPTVEEPATREL